MYALCQGNHTANYRECQVHKELYYEKTIPETKISKPNLSYSQIVNEGETLINTQRDPLNANDSASFPNLTSHSPKQHYHKNIKNTTNNTPNDSEVALQ